MDQEKLIELAWLARENAYTPYSHFKVGACVALKDGTYVQGCNIENAAYGSTMCAERNDCIPMRSLSTSFVRTCGFRYAHLSSK